MSDRVDNGLGVRVEVELIWGTGLELKTGPCEIDGSFGGGGGWVGGWGCGGACISTSIHSLKDYPASVFAARSH